MNNSKLQRIREELAQQKIDGLIITHEDSHGSEYLAESDERVNFVSNFSGSNGVCFVSQSEAVLWTDSRYYIQAEKELEEGWKMKKIEAGEQLYFNYIAQQYPHQTIGYNPQLMTIQLS